MSAVESDDAWAAKVVNFGRDDGADAGDAVIDDEINVADLMAEDDCGAGTAAHEPVDLDVSDKAVDKGSRFDHKVAWRFGGLVAAGVIATLVSAVVFYWPDSRSGPPIGGSLGEPQAVAVAKPAPPTAAGAAAGVDRALPYAADAQGSCAPGSTPAQTMSGNDPRNAFKCVRAGGDGQTISIDLGRTYVITAISITPGWIGKDASGVSQWSQHRVVTLVQYMFDNDPTSLVTQDTKNVHGEAVQPIKHQLASKIQILIRQTSRPPAEPPQPSAAPAPVAPGLGPIFSDGAPTPALTLDPVTGQPTDGNSDPVDATFAISSLKILGHEAV
ncbi:hypothetical protein [Mycobacterium riyadhense]|uniref:F5/8 type C domain-containing protein n=1 Tax=Mycobacterium riyadhense TaxID=486698 RepID=A0A1X2DI72_9MYCO|nr:hypothetical protein [Mycobacterium riyadhense]MCV7148266.1 hypothetical protein [Mycobacterium riyadhense]ORW87852.1 hypothetical protein AWC22_00040 [Mycobacterium riyadhense]